MFNEYEVVKLKTDLPADTISKGAVGTVLMILDPATPIQYYIVEFMDGGISLGTPIVPETAL